MKQKDFALRHLDRLIGEREEALQRLREKRDRFAAKQGSSQAEKPASFREQLEAFIEAAAKAAGEEQNETTVS